MKNNVTGSADLAKEAVEYDKADLEKESIELLKKIFDTDLFDSVIEEELSRHIHTKRSA